MKAVEQNPYRTLGLLVGATAKEQNRQITRLKRFIEAEQEPEDNFSFPVLGEVRRTLNDVEAAASKLNLDNDKMHAALFWFWNGNPITDEVVFDALKDEEKIKALDIWRKLVVNKKINEKNASAYHNLSIYLLCTEKNDSKLIADAIKYQIEFLESDFVKDFKVLITDATYKATQKDLQLLFLNQILLEVEHNRMMTISEFVNLLNGLSFTAKEIFLNNLAQKRIEKIERNLNAAKTKRKADQSNAGNTGKRLYATTHEELILLQDMLGTDNIEYLSIADKVADEILQCGIGYFLRYRSTNIDPINISMNLFEKAKSLAVGKIATQSIEEKITELQKIQYQEYYSAIDLLKSIKKSYDNLQWNQTIDTHKIKTDIQTEITDEVIRKIATCEKDAIIKEFDDLLRFISGKQEFAGVGFLKRYYLQEALFMHNIQIANANLSDNDEEITVNILKSIKDTCTTFPSHDFQVIAKILKERITDDMITKLVTSKKDSLINEFYILLKFHISNYKSDEVTNILFHIEQTFYDKMTILKTDKQ